MPNPVDGCVTLENNRAVMVLNVTTGAQAEEEKPTTDFASIPEQISARGSPGAPKPVAGHVMRKNLVAIVCNFQKGIEIETCRPIWRMECNRRANFWSA